MELTELFIDIADSIRKRDGTDTAMKASDFPERVMNIPTGLDDNDVKNILTENSVSIGNSSSLDSTLNAKARHINIGYDHGSQGPFINIGNFNNEGLRTGQLNVEIGSGAININTQPIPNFSFAGGDIKLGTPKEISNRNGLKIDGYFQKYKLSMNNAELEYVDFYSIKHKNASQSLIKCSSNTLTLGNYESNCSIQNVSGDNRIEISESGVVIGDNLKSISSYNSSSPTFIGGKPVKIASCFYENQILVADSSEGGIKIGSNLQHNYSDNAILLGRYNTSNTTNNILIIGNGNSGSNSNAMRLTGSGYLYYSAGIGAGADYAEFFEWADGNPYEEDRIGIFVTFDFESQTNNHVPGIKPAQPGDYILGVISGNPSFIGNGDEEWKKRWLYDDFDRPVCEPKQIPITEFKEVATGDFRTEVEYDDDDNEIEVQVPITEFKEVPTGEYKTEIMQVQNPEYDPDMQYKGRLDRKEWATTGMLGVLAMRDDGTCQIGQYCKCGPDGIATAAEKRDFDTYMVIDRVKENIIKIVFR